MESTVPKVVKPRGGVGI